MKVGHYSSNLFSIGGNMKKKLGKKMANNNNGDVWFEEEDDINNQQRGYGSPGNGENSASGGGSYDKIRREKEWQF